MSNLHIGAGGVDGKEGLWKEQLCGLRRIMALDHTKNLVYVGMTGARYRLIILYVNE